MVVAQLHLGASWRIGIEEGALARNRMCIDQVGTGRRCHGHDLAGHSIVQRDVSGGGGGGGGGRRVKEVHVVLNDAWPVYRDVALPQENIRNYADLRNRCFGKMA